MLGLVGQALVQDNPETGDLFGSALASGSFRHNGHFDLAVGAPGEDLGARLDIGAVALFLDQAGGITPGSPRTVTQREAGGAEETGDQFGSALATGLYNGDDFYDLAIGTPVDPTPYLLGYLAAGKSSAGAKAASKSRHCRPNADARKGRDTDPLTARLDRCP